MSTHLGRVRRPDPLFGCAETSFAFVAFLQSIDRLMKVEHCKSRGETDKHGLIAWNVEKRRIGAIRLAMQTLNRLFLALIRL